MRHAQFSFMVCNVAEHGRVFSPAFPAHSAAPFLLLAAALLLPGSSTSSTMTGVLIFVLELRACLPAASIIFLWAISSLSCKRLESCACLRNSITLLLCARRLPWLSSSWSSGPRCPSTCRGALRYSAAASPCRRRWPLVFSDQPRRLIALVFFASPAPASGGGGRLLGGAGSLLGAPARSFSRASPRASPAP